mgnify:CR=1 FL=1
MSNPKTVSELFGCTVEQARAQYLKCATELDKMADAAKRNNCTQRGYTESDLRERAADQRRRANLV